MHLRRLAGNHALRYEIYCMSGYKTLVFGVMLSGKESPKRVATRVHTRGRNDS